MVRILGGRILGIDWGERRVGLALSDPSRTIASPLPTLIRKGSLKTSAAELLQEFALRGVDEVVIGQPYHLDGNKSKMSLEIDALILLLKETSPNLIYTLWDERLTTAQAERFLKEAGLNRKRRATVVDRVAALIILQSYLDSLTFKH